MTKINKLFAVIAAFVLSIAAVLPAASVMAADNGTETVTIHKILQTKDNLASDKFPGTTGLNGDKYTGQSINDIIGYFGDGSKEIADAYFVLATKDGAYIKAGADQLTPLIENGAPVTTTNVDEAVGGLTTNSGLEIKTASLPAGDYQLIELKEKSTYNNNGAVLADSKAVPVVLSLPIVNENGTVTDAHVYPKNTETKPQIDKNFKDAGINYNDNQRNKGQKVATVGDKVPFVVSTKILQGSDYKKLKWIDSMTKGLTFNNDIVVAGAGLLPEDYITVADDQGFTLSLKESGLKKVADVAKTADVEITLNYTATVNSAAVVGTPDKNDVKLDYGNNPFKESEPTPGQPKESKITVKKTWAKDSNEITAADEDVTAVFTLQVQENGKWVNVDSYTVGRNENFTHEFTGLDNNKTYRVVERVSGYDAEYVSMVDGVATIKNNKDSDNPTPLEPSEPEVVTYGKKFVKTNGNGTTLAGAVFAVKNSEGKYLATLDATTTEANKAALAQAKTNLDAAITAYNNLTTSAQTQTEKDKVTAAQTAYNKAFAAAKQSYTWVASSSDANVVKLVSNDKGQFEITGLAAGTYQLEELVAPKGYAKLTGTQQFVVNANSYAAEGNIDYATAAKPGTTADEVVNKKISIPQTGGIGTIIFAVAGAVIMLIAGVAYMKNKKEDEIA